MSHGDLNSDFTTNISDLNLYLDNPTNFTETDLSNVILNWNVSHPNLISSINQVDFISNMDLYATRNLISSTNGQTMAIATLGASRTGVNGDEYVYYSQDGGVNWSQSTINTAKTLGQPRLGSITTTGQYSIFYDGVGVNFEFYTYYSSDYCATYNYIGKTETTYYGRGPWLNEDGTIAIFGSFHYNSPYKVLHVCYINKQAL